LATDDPPEFVFFPMTTHQEREETPTDRWIFVPPPNSFLE
jgi:hypothetical protein